jgi:hypothetical protein
MAGLVGRNFVTAPPLVVPKTRTTNLGGESAARTTIPLSFDIAHQGISDLRWMLRSIAASDTAQQIALQNPPAVVEVDNKPAREFEDAQRKIVVLFGTRLAAAAMRLAEQTLRQSIQRATQQRTGRLADVAGAWRWKLITPGRGVRIVTAASELGTFTRGSVLVLEPYAVPYATRVNSLVLGSGSLKSRRASARPRPGQMGPPKPKQAVGFLRATAEALRARQEFRQFAITVAFSKAHLVPHEVSRKQGTGSLVIQLKRR